MMTTPQMLMNNRANYFANAMQQPNVDPRLMEQARQFAMMQNQMQQRKPGPAGSDMWARLGAMQMMNQQGMGNPQTAQRQNPNFYTPDWQAMYGPSLNNAQVQAQQSQQQMQNGVGGQNGPIRRGLGNLFSGLGRGGGNFMDNWRRGYQARRGMGGMIPGL